jgi:RNA polymerase sigma factor (sigma-70 family)
MARKGSGQTVGHSGRLEVMQWVVREVLVHEPALRSWLRKVTDANDVEDIVQESYCRISNLDDISHIRNARAYLFTTAKMIVLGRVRRSRIVSIDVVADIESFNVADEASDPEQIAIEKDQLNFVTNIIGNLPSRCRNIFLLRKMEGLSQREVAQRLGIPEHTVENDVAKGLRLIQQAIAETEEQGKTSEERMTKHGTNWVSAAGQ